MIKTPDPPYNLQGVVEDLTIRNNVFYECGEMAEKTVIALNLQAKFLDYRSPVYTNVKILENLFIRKETDVTSAKGAGERRGSGARKPGRTQRG